MPKLKTVAPIIPYFTVPLGLFLFDSGWASILLFHLGIVVVLYLARYWNLGKMLNTWHEYLIMIATAIISALGGLFIFIFWPVLKLEGLALGAELATMGLQNTPWLLFIFYYFTVNPILEELFWRGYLGSPSLKPASSDFWYAGYHILILILFVEWPWIVLNFVILVGAGWAWRQLARIYKGLTIPIVSHAAADASIISAVFLLAQ